MFTRNLFQMQLHLLSTNSLSWFQSSSGALKSTEKGSTSLLVREVPDPALTGQLSSTTQYIKNVNFLYVVHTGNCKQSCRETRRAPIPIVCSYQNLNKEFCLDRITCHIRWILYIGYDFSCRLLSWIHAGGAGGARISCTMNSFWSDLNGFNIPDVQIYYTALYK